jgi:hypothetical protein
MKTGLAVTRFLSALVVVGVGTLRAQTGSQAEIAFQGYCQSDDTQLASIAGVAANFRTFFPGFGILSGSVETYSGDSRFRAGKNYVDVNGPTWFGLHWRVTGGDFRASMALLPLPFTNFFLPDLGAEGLKVEASTASRRYTLFYGEETLASGVRVPFLIRVPQKVLGASMVDKIGDRLEIGIRALHLSTNTNFAASTLFAPGQDFHATTGISAETVYRISSNLQFYGEATASSASASRTFPGTSPNGLSLTVGPAWRSRKLTIKANYIREKASYLPVAGYFLGDRSGPYIEAQYKPIERVELFGSSSDYRNNLNHSSELATFQSVTNSAGVSVSLPFRLSASGQLSDIDFSVNNRERTSSLDPTTSSSSRLWAGRFATTTFISHIGT